MKEAGKSIDILGLGVVAVDDLLFIPSYPQADTKVQISRRERHCGGLTATALVAASRLGCRCSYAGVLGSDDLSEFAINKLSQEGIDFSHLIRRVQASPIFSTIIVDETHKSRNIFFDVSTFVGADDELPDAAVIREAKVLFVDHLSPKGMLRAARIARAAGIPVVADFEASESPYFTELINLVDHLIVSHNFATTLTRETDPLEATKKLWTRDRKVVVTTSGADGCWYVSDSHPSSPIHQPAFPVKVVDTTGCGDVFHGAYAAGLVRNMELQERIQVASAAAALKAAHAGGQNGIPTIRTVERFLKGESRHES
jgi:sulfofructose kinase